MHEVSFGLGAVISFAAQDHFHGDAAPFQFPLLHLKPQESDKALWSKIGKNTDKIAI